jgi:hypothetical protein
MYVSSTDDDKLYIFKRCTGRLECLGNTVITDAELVEVLEQALGIAAGGGPDTPDYSYKGNGIRIWGGWEYHAEGRTALERRGNRCDGPQGLWYQAAGSAVPVRFWNVRWKSQN